MVQRSSGGTSTSLREAGEEGLGQRLGLWGYLTFQRPHNGKGLLFALRFNSTEAPLELGTFTHTPGQCPDPPMDEVEPGLGTPLHGAIAQHLGMNVAHPVFLSCPVAGLPCPAHPAQRPRAVCHTGRFVNEIYGWEHKSLEELKAALHTCSIWSPLALAPQPQLRGSSGAISVFNWAPDHMDREVINITRKTVQKWSRKVQAASSWSLPAAPKAQQGLGYVYTGAEEALPQTMSAPMPCFWWSAAQLGPQMSKQEKGCAHLGFSKRIQW